MSTFYVTNISEKEYLEIYKKQRKQFKESGTFPDIMNYIDPDEIGINGAEKLFLAEEDIERFSDLDCSIVDHFMDNDEFIERYFNGEYCIDDYFNDNIRFASEYWNIYLFLDLPYLEMLLETYEGYLEEADKEVDRLHYAHVRRVIKMLIRYKSKFGLNVAYKRD